MNRKHQIAMMIPVGTFEVVVQILLLGIGMHLNRTASGIWSDVGILMVVLFGWPAVASLHAWLKIKLG